MIAIMAIMEILAPVREFYNSNKENNNIKNTSHHH